MANQSLRDVQRFFHVNVNCANFEQVPSRSWLELKVA